MSKTTENEEENQLLLKKIMNLIPKDEQAELMQKVDNLTSKNNLSNNNISKSRKVKNKNDKYDVSNDFSSKKNNPKFIIWKLSYNKHLLCKDLHKWKR